MTAPELFWLEAGHWDIFVAVYLFLGGVSGGSYVVASIAETVAGRSEYDGYEHVTRWGLLTAFVTIAVGSITLLLHLSGPFIRAFTFPVSFTNWTSWMAIGTWVIVLFSLLVTVRLLWATFGAKATADPSGLPRQLVAKLGVEGLLDRLADATRPTGILDMGVRLVGVGLAVLVVVYTGLLLSDVGWNVPLWDPRLLPLLFLASGVSAGTAAVVMLAQLASNIDSHLVHRFSLFDDAVITVEIVILGILLYTLATGGVAATETYASLTGPYGPLLWVGVLGLGLVVPLLISGAQQAVEFLREENKLMTKPICSAKFGLVIAGSFMLRFLIVYAAIHQPVVVG
ncbi:NrfD/PsrC family molybdoenzyme membrane anchor subunit [Natranaeroarchaeum aerophilus]|uniref:Polysulfide reductase NrfD n=1 Tax=Natranaeroarchaeum aerophilus TaxID=2917711 RepID=A0AAE3K4N5_9EURY|nr:NrfD/PsrC family molybdoenzyme membrane anchor subunit [Natranaeroarchaeum aerophilus]MCL9813296.1 polysulfide reductase NrfD [Natranaeroarchaeum aerophilus]